MSNILNYKKIFILFTFLVVGLGMFFALSTSVAHAETVIGAPSDVLNGVGSPSDGDGEPGIASNIIGWILRPFAWAFQALGLLFLKLGSATFAQSIDASIIQSLDRFTGIQVGWQVMRDFANLFFIFIILYIAIQTILQLGDHNTKQMLVRVIAVALLINFSAFFTKVVIDTGNVLAVGFYNRIITSPKPVSGGTSVCSNNENCSIGERFSSVLGIPEAGKEVTNPPKGALAISIIYFLNGILFFVLGMEFIRGAFYFIARMLVFMFLIMFSPIAFLSYAVPSSKVSGFMSKWWSKLLGYTFLAPAFMIIIYLVLQVASAMPNTGTLNIMNYVLIVGLLHLGAKQAFELADSTGTAIAGWGSKALGGAAIGAMTGGAALAGRQFVGRAGAYTKDNDTIKRLANEDKGWRGRLARNTIKYSDKATKASFDISKTKLGGSAVGSLGAKIPGMMQGGDGGFKKTGGFERKAWSAATLGLATPHGLGKHSLGSDEREKIYKEANDLFPKDPAAREAYIKQKTGGFVSASSANGGSLGLKESFTEDKSKEGKAEKKSIATGKRKKEHEKNLKDNLVAAKAGDSVAREKVVTAMQQLGPSLVAELEETMLTDIAEYLSRADVNAIHKRHAAGEYTDGEATLTSIGAAINGAADIDEKTAKNQEERELIRSINSQRENTKEYLASEEGRRDLFSYRIPASAYTSTKKYKNAAINTKNATDRQGQEQKALDALKSTFNNIQDSEGKHIIEDITSLEKEMQEYADFAMEESGGGPWKHEHTNKLNELTGKIRSKRREFEKRIEKSTMSPVKQVEVERLKTSRANLDMSVSSATREAAELDAQIAALEKGT